jgi:hypothetical protein
MYAHCLQVGRVQGRLTSHYGPLMQRYSSIAVVPPTATGDTTVRQLLSVDDGVLALSATRLRLQQRTGLPLMTAE